MNGDKQYLVRWMGYQERTWEPESIIAEAQANDLLDDYKRRWNLKYPNNPYHLPESGGGKSVAGVNRTNITNLVSAYVIPF